MRFGTYLILRGLILGGGAYIRKELCVSELGGGLYLGGLYLGGLYLGFYGIIHEITIDPCYEKTLG